MFKFNKIFFLILFFQIIKPTEPDLELDNFFNSMSDKKEPAQIETLFNLSLNKFVGSLVSDKVDLDLESLKDFEIYADGIQKIIKKKFISKFEKQLLVNKIEYLSGFKDNNFMPNKILDIDTLGNFVITTVPTKEEAFVWDLKSKVLLCVIPHEGHLAGATFSKNLKNIITWGDSGMFLWEINILENNFLCDLIEKIEHLPINVSPEISFDSNLLLTLPEFNTICLSNLTTGQKILKSFSTPISQVKFNPDGSLVAVIFQNGQLKLFNSKDLSKKQIDFFNSTNLSKSSFAKVCIDFSFNSNFIALSSGNQLTIFDLITNKIYKKLDYIDVDKKLGDIKKIQFSQNSKFILVVGESYAILYDIFGNIIQSFEFEFNNTNYMLNFCKFFNDDKNIIFSGHTCGLGRAHNSIFDFFVIKSTKSSLEEVDLIELLKFTDVNKKNINNNNNNS